MAVGDFPWYTAVEGDDFEQGDILLNCPIFSPVPDLSLEDLDGDDIAPFLVQDRDVIVMSQTCDMVLGREKLTDVLLCPIFVRSKLPVDQATPKFLEDARRGNLPSLHMLSGSTIEGLHRDIALVDFRSVHSLPLPFLRQYANSIGPRLRLLPPYRERRGGRLARV